MLNAILADARSRILDSSTALRSQPMDQLRGLVHTPAKEQLQIQRKPIEITTWAREHGQDKLPSSWKRADFVFSVGRRSPPTDSTKLLMAPLQSFRRKITGIMATKTSNQSLELTAGRCTERLKDDL